jgi:hypothetical protein
MSKTETVLLIIAVCMLVLLVWQTARIRFHLGRIEERLTQVSAAAEPSADDTASVEPNPGGLFESFLAGDPSRLAMSKSEQFAAFRQWRKEKGLNWSSGG